MYPKYDIEHYRSQATPKKDRRENKIFSPLTIKEDLQHDFSGATILTDGSIPALTILAKKVAISNLFLCVENVEHLDKDVILIGPNSAVLARSVNYCGYLHDKRLEGFCETIPTYIDLGELTYGDHYLSDIFICPYPIESISSSPGVYLDLHDEGNYRYRFSIKIALEESYGLYMGYITLFFKSFSKKVPIIASIGKMLNVSQAKAPRSSITERPLPRKEQQPKLLTVKQKRLDLLLDFDIYLNEFLESRTRAYSSILNTSFSPLCIGIEALSSEKEGLYSYTFQTFFNRNILELHSSTEPQHKALTATKESDSAKIKKAEGRNDDCAQFQIRNKGNTNFLKIKSNKNQSIYRRQEVVKVFTGCHVSHQFVIKDVELDHVVSRNLYYRIWGRRDILITEKGVLTTKLLNVKNHVQVISMFQ